MSGTEISDEQVVGQSSVLYKGTNSNGGVDEPGLCSVCAEVDARKLFAIPSTSSRPNTTHPHALLSQAPLATVKTSAR